MRVIAVDWSGDAAQAHKRMWLAEVHRPGQVARLEAGRGPRALGDHLVDLLETSGDQPTVIGLDFGFSYPAWFLDRYDLADAVALWDHVSQHGETWLSECSAPFWGRPGRPRPSPDLPDTPFRRCELAVPRVGGTGPKSLFQIGGAGAAGTGSIRGMPLLARLQREGARIWPYSDGTGLRARTVVLEIYPRLLTRAVVKSRAGERVRFMRDRYPNVRPDILEAIQISADAFDAAASALVMAEHWSDLTRLPDEPDPVLRREGRIWHPDWRSDLLLTGVRSRPNMGGADDDRRWS